MSQVDSQFENVTIVKKANVYFDGQVISRTVKFADGTEKTLGFMQPGEYEFGTADKEIMGIISGELDVLLPNTSDWLSISDGESFEVPAGVKFSVNIKTPTDYSCSYIK